MKWHYQDIARIILLLATTLLFLNCCKGSPLMPEIEKPGDFEYLKERTSRLIKKEMKKDKVTGLSIALVDDQKVIWAQGFGYADKAGKVPATPETVYRIGSIAKLFTVTAAMQLFEQGKIDIDKPLQTYLPEFSMETRFSRSTPITIRSLMTHHSGLPSNLLKGMWSKDPEPFTQVVSRIRNEYVAYPPNFIYAYSNLGFTLLGHVVERVSRKDFVTHLDESLLRPLGMIHSSFSLRSDLLPLLSKGYMSGREAEEPCFRDIPAGGLNSTVLDMSRFIKMIFAHGRAGEQQIIKPKTLVEMFRAQNRGIDLDLGFRIGLGWMLSGINIQNVGPVAYHRGKSLLFHSHLIILPKLKLGVVVLANSSTARNLVDRAAIEVLKLGLEVKSAPRDPVHFKQIDLKKSAKIESSPQQAALLPQDLQAYEGYYATRYGLAKIFKRRGHLKAQIMNKTYHLVPRGDGLLGLKYKLFGLIPISLGNLEHVGHLFTIIGGHEILLARSGSNNLLVGEKIKPVIIPQKWLSRVGTYKIANPGDDIILFKSMRLRYYDGFLLLECSLPLFSDNLINFVIDPVSDEEGVIFGLGKDMGDTIRAVTVNSQEYLYYSGYLLKRIR